MKIQENVFILYRIDSYQKEIRLSEAVQTGVGQLNNKTYQNGILTCQKART